MSGEATSSEEMSGEANGNSRAIAEYISSARDRRLPPEVVEAARLCLADWMGVALGAAQEESARVVREVLRGWNSQGRSSVLFGGSACATVAALANGTLAHSLDFDDTHVKSVTHISAPVWAATLALGEDIGASDSDMLLAFVTGFETASRAGAGLGEAVTARGWHATGVFGRLGAAAASAVLLGLNVERTVHALGAAATQTSGLTASFGTLAKPFHAGKAAMDGILAAQLAFKGFRAATGLLDPGAGLDSALVQDGSARFRRVDFSGWEILSNSFKPYAACHLTHPAVDAAYAVAAGSPGVEPAAIRAIRTGVTALAKQITGNKSGAPATALDSKFDLKYCVALALHGCKLSALDFRDPWRAEPAVIETAGKVIVEEDPRMTFTSARIEIDMNDGRTEKAGIAVSKGHPGNPMSWLDMRHKFDGLVAPLLHEQTATMFQLLREFGNGQSQLAIAAMLSRL